MNRNQLFAAVWGAPAPTARKIELDPHQPRILLTVRGRGYRLAEAPSED